MKKSLLAVAAITAFAGAAQAQSSVTVYGILDVGYVGGNEKATLGSAKSAETTNAFASSAESSSRLGFKGTEDLGGGMSAFFTAEVDLAPSGNAGTTSSTLIGGNRQTFVGLAKKGVGKGAIGTQYTLMHDATGETSAGQNNNIIGDVIYPKNTNLGGVDSNANGNTIGYILRAANALKFNSDKFAGFGVNAFYSLNNRNENQGVGSTTTVTGGTNNFSSWGVSADYTYKKFYLTAAYQSFKSEITATTTRSTIAFSGTTNIANTTDNQAFVGATYDFGILKAYAQWLNRKATGVNDSNNYASRSAQQIGVRSFITPKIEGWASVGNGRFQSFGAGEPTANFVGYQLGSNYWLSKRTNLYAIYGATGTSTTSNVAGLTNNYNANNYAVGVRHTF